MPGLQCLVYIDISGDTLDVNRCQMVLVFLLSGQDYVYILYTVYSPATTVASSSTRLYIWTGLCVYTVYSRATTVASSSTRLFIWTA